MMAGRQAKNKIEQISKNNEGWTVFVHVGFVELAHMNDATQNQMELTLNSKAFRRGRTTRLRRRQRSQWWFNQMRQAVDSAMDWRPTPPARPEQVYLTLTR